MRNGREKTVKVKIAKRPEERLAARSRPPEQTEEFGIRVSDLTPEITQRYNIDESAGIVVTQVDSGSKGDGADVRVGDIIKEINRKPVKNVSEYKSLLRQITTGDSVHLFIRRKNAGFLVVKLIK